MSGSFCERQLAKCGRDGGGGTGHIKARAAHVQGKREVREMLRCGWLGGSLE